MDAYDKQGLIGEGTYGAVYKAVHKETGRIVAVKKVRIGESKDGVSTSALREIMTLQELNSPYVIRMLDSFPHKKNLMLVFEYMETDLNKMIKDSSVRITQADVKAYMKMVLSALDHIHSNSIVHRDVKPDNLLVSSCGDLKLADFGLARVLTTPDAKLTHQVCMKSSACFYILPQCTPGCISTSLS